MVSCNMLYLTSVLSSQRIIPLGGADVWFYLYHKWVLAFDSDLFNYSLWFYIQKEGENQIARAKNATEDLKHIFRAVVMQCLETDFFPVMVAHLEPHICYMRGKNLWELRSLVINSIPFLWQVLAPPAVMVSGQWIFSLKTCTHFYWFCNWMNLSSQWNSNGWKIHPNCAGIKIYQAIVLKRQLTDLFNVLSQD